MKLYINTTSPFVRPVRIAIEEKGLADKIALEIVDPWGDVPEFLKANGAGRVPALVTDDGHAIAESALILRYPDEIAAPSIFPAGDLAETLSIAAPAIGAIDAAVAIIISRKSAPGFDNDMVGTKRHRTMADGLVRLNARLPRDFDDTVLIYSSDQGFFLGDHGWFDKRLMYEESLGMPLLIQYPKRIEGGATCDDIVVNVPVLGEYSDTWPLNCPKSERIVRQAGDEVAGRGRR